MAGIDAVSGIATTVRDGVDAAAFDLPARDLLAVFGKGALDGSLTTADGSDAGVSSRGILPQEFGPGQRLADVEDEILRTVLRIVTARRPAKPRRRNVSGACDPLPSQQSVTRAEHPPPLRCFVFALVLVRKIVRTSPREGGFS